MAASIKTATRVGYGDDEEEKEEEKEEARVKETEKKDPFVDYEVVNRAEGIYNTIVEGCTTQEGFRASHKGRKKLSEDDQQDSSFHFGEALFRPIACAIEKVKRKYGGLPADGGGVFYDLGSGTGKVTVAAALMHKFDRAVGIEIIPELHKWGKEIESRFKASQSPFTQHTEVTMVLGDIRDECLPWWSDADLVFCNTLAFSRGLLEIFAERLSRLRSGVIIIHSGRVNEITLFQKHFDLLEFGFHRFSWGSSSIWYHRKK